MKLVVIGCGHVGLVTALGFAEIGHRVVGVDSSEERVAQLRRGEPPFHEPGLPALLDKHGGRSVTFERDVAKALEGADAAFICVNTPPRPDGSASLVYVEQVARQVAEAARGPIVVVEKSTVPVRTSRRIIDVLRSEGRYPEIEVATNPEFLREGRAVEDTLYPDRIVVGVAHEGRAESVMREIYAPLVSSAGCPLIVTDLETAELIKHSSNSFLAMKISYMNAVARLCEKTGANIDVVAEGMGLDPRIGPHHMSAGLGFGGSCFPKDIRAFIAQAREFGLDFSFLEHVRRINDEQRDAIVDKVRRALWNLEGKTIAVWGLAFKPGTDDLREAPSLGVVPIVEREGATIRAYDPAVGESAREAFPNADIVTDAMSAVKGADALLVLTEWPEFVECDLKAVRDALRRPVVIDGRNIWPVELMAELGFTYLSFGRPDVVDGAIRSVVG